MTSLSTSAPNRHHFSASSSDRRNTIAPSTPKSDTAPLAQHLAQLLNETDQQAIHDIHRIIDELGVGYVQRTAQKTFEIEHQGGLKTVDGSRRRTAGGTFFFLVRHFLKLKTKKSQTWKLRAARLADIYPQFQYIDNHQ